MSTLTVQNIQGSSSSNNTISVADGHKLDVTLVKAEGSATTNLKQGLCKVWQQSQGDSTTPTDSFNVSNITDNGTGAFTTNFTNAMNNAFYSGLTTGMSGDHLISNVSATQTGQCKFDHYSQSNSAIDTGLHCVAIFGDLA